MNTNFRLLGLDTFPDLSNKRVFIGISGGINSAAVLCYLATIHPEPLRPKTVYSFYAHLKEHTADTLPFVRALAIYGKKHFPFFSIKFSVGSVNELFRKEKFIPHPILSPCSERLKIIPIMKYKASIEADVDLVGFVYTERQRMKRQQAKAENPGSILYPISAYSDEDCLALVKRELGWYPHVYDIRDESGKRVFMHNNCMPCKNMQGNLFSDGTATKHYAAVKTHFPTHYQNALDTLHAIEEKTGKPNWWGRPVKDTDTVVGCNDYVCE